MQGVVEPVHAHLEVDVLQPNQFHSLNFHVFSKLLMATQVLNARNVRITQTCDTAKEFLDRFYKRMDEERHMAKNMFEDTGKLIFNGHGYVGVDNIGKFHENLPNSMTRMSGFDAHEIDEVHLGGTPGILISVTGSVKYGRRGTATTFDERGSDPKAFVYFETFLITAKSGTWKIQSDNFRFQNSNTESMLQSDLWNVSMQE